MKPKGTVPRAKPIRNLTPRAPSTRISLSSADQADLAEILNLEEPRFRDWRQRALRQVEETLSTYPDLATFDDRPTPASILAEIEPLIRPTKQTYGQLSQLSRPAKNHIRQAGSPDVAWGPFGDPPPEVQRTINANTRLLRRVQKDLPALVDRLRLVKGSLEARRKGRRKQWALKLTALCLSADFKKYYRPDGEDRDENARDEFIWRSLKILPATGAIKQSKRTYRKFVAYLLRRKN